MRTHCFFFLKTNKIEMLLFELMFNVPVNSKGHVGTFKIENLQFAYASVNKGADEPLCFRYTDSTIPLLCKSKLPAASEISGLWSSVLCTARFVLDLFRNHIFCFQVARLNSAPEVGYNVL